MPPLTPNPKGRHDEPSQRATRLTRFPSARVNDPPATRLPSYPARAYTAPSMPLPMGDQEKPFQRATPRTGTPPAAKNAPPAYRDPLNENSVKIRSSRPLPELTAL